MQQAQGGEKYLVNKYLSHVYIQEEKYIPSDIFTIRGEKYVFLHMMDIGTDIELELMLMEGVNRGKKYYAHLTDVNSNGFDLVRLIQ